MVTYLSMALELMIEFFMMVLWQPVRYRLHLRNLLLVLVNMVFMYKSQCINIPFLQPLHPTNGVMHKEQYVDPLICDSILLSFVSAGVRG